MKKALAIVAAAAFVSLVFAAPADAAETPPDCKTVTSNITDRPDSGLYGNWALDSFKRTVEVCHVPDVSVARVEVKSWHYTAKGKDEGSFKTIGVKSFMGNPMKPSIVGTFSGTFSLSFNAPAEWSGFKDSVVKDSNAYATSEWLSKLWTIDGYEPGQNYKWSWTYKLCNETLTNASPSNGGNSGDITGYSRKPCISVSFKDTCTGTEVTVKNGATFDKAWAWIKVTGNSTFVLTGGATKTVTVPNTFSPIEVFLYVGEQKDDDKAIVDYKSDGKWNLLDSHKWVKPQSCESPAPSTSVTASAQPSGSTAPVPGGTLPVTGSKIWVLAGSGALLIAIGVAAMLVARNRRTAFSVE